LSAVAELLHEARVSIITEDSEIPSKWLAFRDEEKSRLHAMLVIE
jgi:hypothetical protein